MKKVLVLSIPHTGTDFVMKYLKTTPCKDSLYNTYIGSYAGVNHYPDEEEVMEYAKENCKVIIPLRHPIETAISYINRYKEMASCANNWNVLIDYIIPRYDIFWFDINIDKQNRHNMVNKLNEFIGQHPSNAEYVDDWKPVNCYQGDSKQEYNFEGLDYAKDWYNNKNTELNKLYAN